MCYFFLENPGNFFSAFSDGRCQRNAAAVETGFPAFSSSWHQQPKSWCKHLLFALCKAKFCWAKCCGGSQPTHEHLQGFSPLCSVNDWFCVIPAPNGSWNIRNTSTTAQLMYIELWTVLENCWQQMLGRCEASSVVLWCSVPAEVLLLVMQLGLKLRWKQLNFPHWLFRKHLQPFRACVFQVL